MNSTALKLGGFVVALAAVFALAIGVGNAAGPFAATDPEHGGDHDEASSAGGGHSMDGGGGHAGMAASGPGGLMISQHGYTLALDQTTLAAGEDVAVRFRVLGPDRAPVTRYNEIHDKELHFIAVRRDMAGFQHVHPTRSADGTWRTSLDLTPGSWRFFADFQPAEHGETMTLGADLAVPGRFDPQPSPEPARTARVGDYTVTLDGTLRPGESSELTLRVTRNGKPVTDLQPYLGAYGHLVALRNGDLAYLHVHPDGAPGDGTTAPGPEITFYATAPSAGDYRLFLDFKHQATVRTAAFTARATGGKTSTSATEDGATDTTGGGGHGGDDHSH